MFEAVKFYQKACNLNSGGGCFNLGVMYEKRVLNVLILGLNMLHVKMLSKMISRRSSFPKRRVI